MKTITFIIAILLAALLPALGADGIKIYNPDGTYQSYPISEIESISFEEMSYSTVFEVYVEGESAFQLYTHSIDSIVFADIEQNSLNIIHHGRLFNWKDTTFFYTVDIDSVLIYNTNKRYGRIYSSIEINIEGLVANYQRIKMVYDPWEGTEYDTTYFSNELSIDNTDNFFDIQISDMMYPETCPGCGEITRTGDLFFCINDAKISNEGGEDWSKDCMMQIVNLYFNETSQKIDSLIFVYSETTHSETGPSDHESKSYTFKKLKLTDIDFTLSGYKEINVNLTQTDLSNLEYFDETSASSQAGGGYLAAWHRVFLGFDPPTEPITIKIVIK